MSQSLQWRYRLQSAFLMAIVVVVFGGRGSLAQTSQDCTTCSGNAVLTVSATAPNPEKCSSESDNCDSTSCDDADYLVACPLIQLTGSSCANRLIIFCDSWSDVTNPGSPVAVCSRCSTKLMSAPENWNPGSLYCYSNNPASGPGPGDYRYDIFALDITGLTGTCGGCPGACSANCEGPSDCDQAANRIGCVITLPN